MNKPDSMTIDTLREQARRYFDRPSLSMPVFLGHNTLAILDDRSGVPQLSTLDVSTGDLSAVTSHEERILGMQGSSQGRVAFGMDHGGDERQQIWTWAPGDERPEQLTDVPESMHEPGVVSKDGSIALVKSNARDEATFDIVAMDLTSGVTKMVLREAGTAFATGLTADNRRALIIRSNTNLDADVWIADLDAAEPRNLTAHDGEAWMLGAAFSPDESKVHILSNDGVEFVRLIELDLETGARRVLVEDGSHDVEAFKVSPDGQSLAVSINESGWSRIEIHSLATQIAPRVLAELPLGTVDRFSWSPDGETLAFGFSTAEDPSSIVVVNGDNEPRWISACTDTERPAVATPELVSFPSFDGRQIPAFLFKPKGEGPFPVLVEIHGGPESQRRLQYASAVPTNQFIQSLGIAVLSLNVRGSTGYGKTWSHLDDKGLRLDAVKDAASAAQWLRTRNDVVSDRIGVMGQSYGGFMTLASLAFHPEEWAVAVDVVGIANFVSFLERTGPWRRTHRSEEYGFLEHDREMLEHVSPLTHVATMCAPLFVIHGRNDPRVPLFEAEQIVAALESRGQEVGLRVFDNEGHGLSKRENRIDGYAEAAQFLAKHLLA